MDIIVCLKQVADLQQIRIKRETREPVLEGAPFIFGQFEKNALEAAVRLKEKNGGKVIALALGNAKIKDTIIEALAMGADEAVIIPDLALAMSGSANVAQVLAAAIRKIGKFDLILMGEGSADNYSGQIIGRVAELLDIPQITYVRELSVEANRVRATRDLEDALEVVEADLPAIVSATSELNTPRLPPLTAILKASKKPIATWSANDLGISADAKAVNTLSNLAPQQERKQVLFEGDVAKAVDELVKQLQKEGVV
ncbi:MAG: electron transfer flavoprotein subunit beta/FixA family protein [Chloroflexi bacterium]|nr:electron transfer flavoprotein subunit beta/FixA family protein [Chloroflexota bacterium]